MKKQAIGSSKTRYLASKLAIHVVFILSSITILLPLLWLLLNSFKSNNELFYNSMSLPSEWLVQNYPEAWSRGLGQYFFNSTFISLTTLAATLLLSSLAAYGLTRFRFKGRELLFLVILGGMALSEQVALVPLYKMLLATKLYNTYLGIILPYIAFRLPFTVFLLRSYFISIPRELEEAAYVDGLNSLQIFFRIVLPVSKPVIASAAIINLRFIWNEFVFALVFLENKAYFTIPIGLMTFKGEMKSDYSMMFAGIIIASVPMVILFLLAQKSFVRGLTSGAVKG